MNDPKIKQQVIDKIKSSTNILVTVSTDPSVDALSAALGLTVVLNKLAKHATAVFSGAIPPAITFLDPEKTFESTTDSLRDFIIALDKEKADHLRYKVEGDVVRIFITPYRTTITSDDLDFSQGDFNVELVLALGVDSQAHLDNALEAHGRILHDATVITVSAGQQTSSLGSIDWRDESASSLSEMLVGLIDGLKDSKDTTPLLDQQTATALLTGVVAETDRFSNPKTSSKVMTVAAQLMAAGADQQLIAAKLQESHEIGQNINENGQIRVASIADVPVLGIQGAIDITHGATLDDIAKQVHAKDQQEAAIEAQVVLAEQVPVPVAIPVQEPIVATPISNAYALETQDTIVSSSVLPTQSTPTVSVPPPVSSAPAIAGIPVIEPLSADLASPTPAVEPITASHAYMSDSPTYNNTMNGSTSGVAAEGPSVDIFAADPSQTEPSLSTIPAPNSAYTLESSSIEQPIVAPLPTQPIVIPAPELAVAPDTRDAESRDAALAAVHATFDTTAPAQPFTPAPGIVLPPPPPLPDFATLGTPTPQPAERLGDIFAPESTLPLAPTSNDPAQFKIPGQ